jgi:poly(ribitol-phosphate) beta-N-acetylglucosaminyltransferase
VIKVSVIVPVYNPGHDIDDCIRSLLDQSLPVDEHELIFVDDGSTDDTPARLDALAAEHPHVTSLHIPNSGWPGRPRNVGMDAAQGEFVFFVDNDDWLGREALERLYARAVEDDADIVLGKVVGRGKKVPRGVFRRNRKNLSMQDRTAPLALLSPHKLFRTSLLREHCIRFPEGRRRLEDHAFVVHAYFHARRISVLADYPSYYWVLRGDRSNASARQWDPAGYYENVREVLDIVDEHTEPGELRDELKRHWYRGKILQRVGGAAFMARDPEWAREIYDEVRRIVLERYGPEYDAGLAFNLRIRARLLRDGTWESMRALATAERGLRAAVTVSELEPRGNGLLLGAEATLAGPVSVVRDGERLRWQPPMGVDPELVSDLLDVSDEIATARMQFVLVSRADESEFLLRSKGHVHLEEPEAGGIIRPHVSARARLAPATAAAGTPLPAGEWTVRAVVIVLGFAAEVRLERADGSPLELVNTEDGRLRDKRAPAPRRPSGAGKARRGDGLARRLRGLAHGLKEEGHTVFRRRARLLEHRAPRLASMGRRALYRPSLSPERSRRGTPQPGDRLVESPVFVMCSVRSGSTLLRVLLGSHSQICAPPELHLRHVGATVKRGYPQQSLREIGLGPRRLTYLLWDRILHRELQRSGKSILINKTPNDAFIADRILECWPNARLIFLLRHPAAIARSRQSVRTQDSEERNLEMVLRYCEAVERARRSYPGLTVRYEDMARDPEAVTRSICEWLGVEWEPEMMNYREHDHGRFRPGLGDWGGNIKSGEIQPPSPPPSPEEIPEALRPLCEAWGYLPAPEGEERPPAAEPTRETTPVS